MKFIEWTLMIVKIPILSIIRYSRNEYWNKANERKWQDSYCERQNHRWKSFCQFYFFWCGRVEFWNYLSLIRRHAFKCYPPLFALNQSNYHLTLLPYCFIESLSELTVPAVQKDVDRPDNQHWYQSCNGYCNQRTSWYLRRHYGWCLSMLAVEQSTYAFQTDTKIN